MKSQTIWKQRWSEWGEDFVRNAAVEALQKKTDRELWEWGEDQNFSTEGNRFRIEQTPYLRRPLECYRDANVMTITVAAPAQSAKTTMAELATSFSISEEGGNILFYAATDEDVKDFAETRMEAHYEKLPRLRAMLHPDSSKSKKQLRIHKDRSWLSMLSANNRKRLQSRTAKRVFGDEPSQWPEGHILEMFARTTRFDRTSSKRVLISTPELMFLPGKVGDDPSPTSFYQQYLNGTQEEWGVRCPECGEWTELGLKNFVWTDLNTGEETKDLQEVKKNLRWQCSHDGCQHTMKDEPRTRAWFSENGSYQANNPSVAEIEGERYAVSFHYTAFAVPWISWFSIVKAFLEAQEVARRGNRIPLKEFVRKKLGEFWREEDHKAREMVVSGGYAGTLDEGRPIWRAEPWAQRMVSESGVPLCFLTVDVQKDHFWVLAREWNEHGGSRKRLVGRVDDWEDIQTVQEDLGIPPQNVFVDSGWKRYGGSSKENEVYRECYKRGWWALKGMDRDAWTWRTKGGSYSRPMSMPDFRDGGAGTKQQGRTGRRRFFMMFSNPTLKDHLNLLKTAQASVFWGVGANAPSWYLQHMEGEAKSSDTGRWEQIGENHLWDCEVMQLVPAYLYALFGGDGTGTD